MIAVGKVTEVWRYPVSSVGGERLARVNVTPQGVEGDRRFALFDAETGLAAAPERDIRWRPALFLQARYAGEDLATLIFPDGDDLRLDDRKIDRRLRDHFGFAVSVGTYGGDTDRDSRLPVVSRRYEPAGLHIVTTASLRRLSALSGVASVESRRFRPTLVVDAGAAEDFVESSWIGRKLAIGRVPVAVTEPTRRCGVTLIAQPGLPEEPGILRTILRRNERNFGVYATAHDSGELTTDDPVYAGI